MTPDAPPSSPDAAIDSGPMCGGAGAVAVIAPPFDPDRVVFTTKVLAHDANGALCGMVDGTSGSEARTMIDVPPSGMVTMYLDDNDGYHGLYTWTAVQPGDELWFPYPQPHGVTAKTVDVEVNVPALVGVTSYEVYVQCEHGGGGLSDPAPVGTFTKSLECPSSTTAVAAMIEADDGTSTQWAVSPTTPLAASGPTTITVGAYMAAATPTMTVHGTTGFDRAFGGYVPGATADYHSVNMLVFTNITADPVTLGPRAVPPTWTTRMNVAVSQSAEPTHTLQLGRLQTTPMPLDVAVATDFQPLLSAQVATGLPRPSITWSTARATTADAVYINAGGWVIATRAEPGTVRFPEVPSALLPDGPAEVKAVTLIDAKSIAGFEDLRRDPIMPFNDPEFSASIIGDPFDTIIP